MPQWTCLLLIVCFCIPSSVGYRSFFHISDLHLNLRYNPSGDASNKCLLPVVDSPAHLFYPSTKYGQYGCDPPPILIDVVLSEMKRFVAAPDFILVSGDIAGHGTGNDVQLNYDSMSNATALLRKYFPDVPLVIALGNNDGLSPNYFPPTEDGLRRLYGLWSSYGVVPADQEATFLLGGYYSVDISGVLRVIALDTNLWNTKQNLTQGDRGQMAWMESQIKSAPGQVIILGHIPPGSGVFRMEQFWFDLYRLQFETIFEKYRSKITGGLFGHTHRDEFKVENGTQVMMTPGVSISQKTNPAFRQVLYNAERARMHDYIQYYGDLIELVDPNSRIPFFKPEYDLQEAFGVQNVSLPDLLGKIERQPEMYQLWRSHLEALYDSQRYAQFCQISCISRSDFEACMAKASQV